MKEKPMTEKERVANQPHDIDVIPVDVHPTKTTKFFNLFSIAALAIVAIAIGIILRWSLADTTVLEIKNSPFPARVVSDPSGATGGIVFLKVDYCKRLDVKGDLRISYVSKSREVFLPITQETGPKTCMNTEVPVVVPKDLARDEYRIKFHVSYDINPLKQNIDQDFESQPFIVGINAPS